MTKEEIKELDNRLDQYFEKYVPMSGMAESLGGEMVRAMMRLLYRWYNDGDKPGVGYGNETCNSSNRFLCSHLGPYCDLDGFIVDSEYDDALYTNVKALLEYLDANPSIFEVANTIDSRIASSDDYERSREYEYEDEDY